MSRRHADGPWRKHFSNPQGRRKKARVVLHAEHAGKGPVLTAEAERKRLALLGEDECDLTGRIMGDPPPGRSALDRKAGKR